MKLSAYTIAANCLDKSDCKSGIQEIRNLIKYRELINKSVPYYVYTRLGKLEDKLQNLDK